MGTHRHGALRIAVALGALLAEHAAGAPLAARTPLAAGPAAPSTPARPAPAERMNPPNKPLELKAASGPAQQVTVEWTVPDQSNGREIQRWLVRACPAVPGNPYAACQQVPGPAAGQASGATMRAQIPARVTYMGTQTPVNGAEICAVNGAGTSCADRFALQSGGAGIAPAQQGGGPTSVKPTGTIGIRAAPGSQTSLNPQPLTPGGAPSATPNRPPSGGIAARAVEAKPAVSVSAKPPEPIVVAGSPLRLKADAPPEPQSISVSAASLRLKTSAAAAPQDISVSASALRLSVKAGSSGSASAKVSAMVALTKNAIAVDAAPLRITVASAPPVQPIVVNASSLTLKAITVAPPVPISVNAVSLKLTVTSPNR